MFMTPYRFAAGRLLELLIVRGHLTFQPRGLLPMRSRQPIPDVHCTMCLPTYPGYTIAALVTLGSSEATFSLGLHHHDLICTRFHPLYLHHPFSFAIYIILRHFYFRLLQFPKCSIYLVCKLKPVKTVHVITLFFLSFFISTLYCVYLNSERQNLSRLHDFSIAIDWETH